MEIHIHDSEVSSITGFASDENDKRNGLTMERVRISTTAGDVTIWLSERQANQLRAALDVLYPPSTPIHEGDDRWEATVRYGEEHVGELDTEHPDLPSMENAGLPVTPPKPWSRSRA